VPSARKVRAFRSVGPARRTSLTCPLLALIRYRVSKLTPYMMPSASMAMSVMSVTGMPSVPTKAPTRVAP
jgi:hypothetical protein